MPKAPKSKTVPASAAPAPRVHGVNVTYRPLDKRGDPTEIVWNKVTFEANIPVRLDPDKHFVLVPYHEIVTMNGINRSVERERKISMIELAKGNPSFEVEGFPRAKAIKPTGKVPPAGAEWAGTNRDELVGNVPWPEDYDPHAGAIVLSGDAEAA